MKKLLSLATVLMGFLTLASSNVHAAPATESFDANMVAKLETYIKECNGPGQDPKPKMAEFAKYLEEHGLKGAKIECGVSNYGDPEPMMTLRGTDGASYFVNFKTIKGGRLRVGEIIEDAATAAGTKRHVLWPVPKKAK